MATTRKVRRIVDALLMQDDDVVIREFERTTVKDSAGRTLYSQGGDGTKIHLVKLTKHEACALLRSLTDAVAYIAEGHED